MWVKKKGRKLAELPQPQRALRSVRVHGFVEKTMVWLDTACFTELWTPLNTAMFSVQRAVSLSIHLCGKHARTLCNWTVHLINWLAESGLWTVNQSATDLPQSFQAPLCLSECGAGIRLRPIKCEQTYRHYRFVLSQHWSCQQRRKWNLQQATRDYSFRCNRLPDPMLSLYSGTTKFRQNANTTWQRNDGESINHRST